MAQQQNSFRIRDHRLKIVCVDCGADEALSAAGGLNPEHVKKRFTAKGWEFDLHDAFKNRCPTCVEKRRGERLQRNNPGNIIGTDIDMNHMMQDTAITTSISLSIRPSVRNAGLYTMVLEAPKLFAPTHLTARPHQDAGIAFCSIPVGGVPCVVGVSSKRWEFEAGQVCYKMDGPVAPVRIEAGMRSKMLAVERLPDSLLPAALRAKKSDVLTLRPTAAPVPAAPKADPFAGAKKIIIGMSLAKSGPKDSGWRCIHIALPLSDLGEFQRAAIEREGNGFKLTIMDDGGNKIALSPNSKEFGTLVLGQKHWWFPLPETLFRRVNVPAYIDPDAPHIWHVPAIPPMLERGVDAVAKADAPPSFAQLKSINADQKSRVRALLEEHFQESTGVYMHDYTDKRIALECEVPVQVVVDLRTLAYGELHPRWLPVYALIDEIADRQRALVKAKEDARHG